MFNDPIIEEIQKIRDEYAKSFKYDLDAICEDLINKQNMQEKKLISFPPKLVEPIKKSA
ncbi:MAG: hypothetical protein HQK70_06585 [Desulfamplus sp.]|nr:hypothetical protein [Desulfamplus sp.]